MSVLDDFLRLVTDGLPEAPRRYELRCHPGVYLALTEASIADPGDHPPGQPAAPLYGTADVITDDGMQPGCWELREDGVVIRQAFRGPDGNLYVRVPPALIPLDGIPRRVPCYGPAGERVSTAVVSAAIVPPSGSRQAGLPGRAAV